MNIIVKGILHIVNIGDCCKTLSVVNKKEMKHFVHLK
jgi:hypothetical protein